MDLKKTVPTLATATLLLVTSLCLSAGSYPKAHNPPATPSTTSESANSSPAQESSLVQQGKLIFDKTPVYAAAYVGNTLSCNDCHLQSGTAPHVAPMIDLAGLFPSFSKRAGHVITLQNRIQECFVRSENGKPLPVDSPQMKAMVAYIDWLSRDQDKAKPYPGRGLITLPALIGDPGRGKLIYASQCAACHGVDGAGVPPVLPAVWGKNSYNDGAGMNKIAKMARFVAYTMPQTHPGILTPQEAYDVSAYIHTMPRPKFNPAYKVY
ncbi:MAG: c-type cytochrome [Acidobacteriaceae bacterium]